MALPSLPDQAERLVRLGVHELAGISADRLREAAASGPAVSLLVTSSPASSLAPLLRLGDKEGFVVEDMTDVDDFADGADLEVPDADLYVVTDIDRGDDLRNWSPDEAYPALTGRGRTPLTLSEGICWLLTHPEQLEPNHCFMTIGTRKRKANGKLDARTPALWISGGTGRDGKERRGAPKLGWCWAGNRHTWLGFASATSRG